jgi:hypothetical protein
MHANKAEYKLPTALGMQSSFLLGALNLSLPELGIYLGTYLCTIPVFLLVFMIRISVSEQSNHCVFRHTNRKPTGSGRWQPRQERQGQTRS